MHGGKNHFRFGKSRVLIFIFGWTTPLRNNDPYGFRHEHPVSSFGQRTFDNKTGSIRVKDQLAKMDWRLCPRGMIYSNVLPFSPAFSLSLSLISSPPFVQPFSIQHTEPRNSLFIKRLFSSGKLQSDPYFITTPLSLSLFICLTHTYCCCITQQPTNSRNSSL